MKHITQHTKICSQIKSSISPGISTKKKGFKKEVIKKYEQ